MDIPPAAQVMSAILIALQSLSEDQRVPVSEEVIAAHLALPVKTIRYYLVSMERLSLVRRAETRASGRGWLLASPQS